MVRRLGKDGTTTDAGILKHSRAKDDHCMGSKSEPEEASSVYQGNLQGTMAWKHQGESEGGECKQECDKKSEDGTPHININIISTRNNTKVGDHARRAHRIIAMRPTRQHEPT